MDTAEFDAKVKELRDAGQAIRSIASKLQCDKGKVERALKRLAAQSESENDQDSTEAAETAPSRESPPSLIPRVSPVALDEKARAAISETASLEAEWRQQQIRRAQETALLERQAMAAEKAATASERELKVLLAKAQLAGPDEATQRRIAELSTAIDSLRQEKVELERKMMEEKHLAEIQLLRAEVAAVKQVGKNQFDLLSEVFQLAVPALAGELAGIRTLVKERLQVGQPLPALHLNPVTPEQAKILNDRLVASLAPKPQPAPKEVVRPACYRTALGDETVVCSKGYPERVNAPECQGCALR